MKPLTPHARKTKAYMAKAPARTAREELLFSQLAFVASVCEAWGKVVSETERPLVISMAKAVSLDNPKLRPLFTGFRRPAVGARHKMKTLPFAKRDGWVRASGTTPRPSSLAE